MRPRFDDRDARIVAERCAKWELREGPRVGDYVQLKNGNLRRIASYSEDSIYTEPRGTFDYYLSHDHMSFSGPIGKAIPKTRLQRMPFARKGPCWIPHHGEHEADNDVHTEVNCRVYMEV